MESRLVAWILTVLAFVASTAHPHVTSLARAQSWIENQFSDGNCCMIAQAEMVVDGQGQPISVVTLASNAVVQKRDSQTGSLLWSYSAGDLWADEASSSHAIALDSNGDAVVAGTIADVQAHTPSLGFVVKLDGSTGQQLWRWTSPPGKPAAGVDTVFTDVVVASDGSVYAVGALWSQATAHDLYAVRLDGVSGQTVWEYVEHGGNPNEPANSWRETLTEASLDGQGNLLAAGTLMQPNAHDWDPVVVRLDLASGSETWRFSHDEVAQETATSMVLRGDGSVVVGTGGYSGGYVFRVTPGAGQLDWLYSQPLLSPYNWTHDLALAADDDIFYGGELAGEGQVFGRIDGNSGTGVWTATIAGGLSPQASAHALDAGSDGHLYAAGSRPHGAAPDSYMNLVKLDGDTGAIHWETLVPHVDDDPLWSRLHDVRVHPAATQVFAVGTEGGHQTEANSLWARTLSAPTDDGQLPPVYDPGDLYLIPLWDNWLLWLVPVEDVARAERELAVRIEREWAMGYELSYSLADLARNPDQLYYLLSDGEGELIDTLATNPERLRGRRAPATLFIERDSRAFRRALELLDTERASQSR